MSARKTIAAPKDYGQEAIQFSASTPVAISVQIEPDDEGNPQFANVDAPDGAHIMHYQRRMCGDHYAEFTAGNTIRSAIGATQYDAISKAAANFATAA